MRLILNGRNGTQRNTESETKSMKKAAVDYKPQELSRKKKVATCSPEFTKFHAILQQNNCTSSNVLTALSP